MKQTAHPQHLERERERGMNKTKQERKQKERIKTVVVKTFNI